MTQKPIDVKVIAVGDKDTGKSALLMAVTTKKFPTEETQPGVQIVDHHSLEANVGGNPVSFTFWDVADTDDFATLRPLSYPGTDVFMVCVSVVEPDSFEHGREKWIPELRSVMGGTQKLVVVGTKVDLRSKSTIVDFLKKSGKKPVSVKEGEDFAKKVGAYAYVEASALTGEGMERLIDILGRAALGAPPPNTEGMATRAEPPTGEASTSTVTPDQTSSKCKCDLQ